MTNLAVVTDADFPSLEREETILGTAGIRLEPPPGPSEAELLTAVRNVDALLVQQRPISAHVLDAAPNLQVIACYGVGVDSVDVEAATERRIYVCNVPDYCVNEVASHALTMLLALSRKLVLGDRLVRTGRWTDFATLKPIETVVDRRLGIVGFGRIGRALASMAIGVGLEIVAYDPLVPTEQFAALGVEQVGFRELLVSSDFISLHVPLLKTTERLVGREEFRLIPAHACLINCSRGRLVDELALIEALESGRLAGAALDVFWDEPVPRNNPLLTMDQVILSPHIAYYSEQALERVQVGAAEEVVRVLSGKEPRHWVNPWSVGESEEGKMRS